MMKNLLHGSHEAVRAIKANAIGYKSPVFQIRFCLSVFVILFFTLSSHAQTTTDYVDQAFNAGSAKELIKYFNHVTEVKINDVGANYSRAQAEPMLRDFFKQNPPTSFEYIHKGTSPEGLKYNIGIYTTRAKSYRVVLLLKKVNGEYVVDTVNFNED
ncbi:protein of unknown function [Reichenbachiella agariperforans]|uniref:DUF4783 domain-containing protein n=2 Tax=Reichenbachiella TaxID=156993 RepID=A0A1M6N959_REIAG|nr:DUF4783 domain-containing protein [Reichenbachiella agariperforans]SHJ92295.1 protein of unknown function [Reichenbachiella agariperforans]